MGCIFAYPSEQLISFLWYGSDMTDMKDPLCPACQSDLGSDAMLKDMTGYQLIFCGKCGFTVGDVNYF
jgi:hypothetical protein